MAGAAIPAPPSKSENDYQAEDDVRTMKRAMEIHLDPARKARAHKHLRKSKKAMDTLDGFMKLSQGQ